MNTTFYHPALRQEVQRVQVKELQHRRDSVKHGVIDFTERDWERFGAVPDRSYSLFIFCNAKSKASASIKMQEHFDSFKLTAQHIKKAAQDETSEQFNAAQKLFFVAIEFDNTQRVFARLGVQSVPWVVYFSPTVKLRCACHCGEIIKISATHITSALRTVGFRCLQSACWA